MKPTVSIVIPAYNAEPHLAGAINSVLAQEFGDWEIVVVDDGSTDCTAQIAQGFGQRVRYECIRHTGLAGARNHGIAAARGEYVALLDADDRWHPRKLGVQLEALADNPSAGACFSATEYVDEVHGSSWQKACTPYPDMVAALLLYASVVGPPSALMVRRETLDRAGPFDETLSHSEDWDMWIRLAQITDILLLKEPLTAYRIHGTNMSQNVRNFEVNMRRVLDKFFADSANSARWGHLKHRAYGNHFWMCAGSHAKAHDARRAASCLARALSCDPQQALKLVPAARRYLAGR